MEKTNIIIIGAGKLGATIAKNLSKRGENTLVIDKDENAFAKLDDFGGFIEQGDALDLSILDQAGIKKAKTVIITTDFDATNLFLADVCFYIYDVPHIYIRLNDANKEKLLENTSIKAICPFSLSYDNFLELYEENQ